MSTAFVTISGVCIALLLSYLVDGFYFGKEFAIPSANIVIYNVLSSDRGPDLYGVESWRFYFSNLFVNFNVSLGFVCIALSLGFKRVFSNRVGIVSFASLLIWFAAMQSRPHKEERFLFVIYPCICLLASYVNMCFLI